MASENIYLGNNKLKSSEDIVAGKFVVIDGEKYYEIRNYHEMSDFFISIVSDSDLWMFISSNGSLSAGRKDRDNALFPYYTDDKITDYRDKTGSKAIFRVSKKDKTYLWEPFTDEARRAYAIRRNLYKSTFGNKIIFEEVNSELGLSFRYGWFNSDKYGFVKRSSLINLNEENIRVEILDGIRNILPYGIHYAFQNEYSNLLDAYKKCELVQGSTLGLFMLSAIPVDRAEPSEALKATTVWSIWPGDSPNILLSDNQLADFRKGLSLQSESDIRASRGAYYINSLLELNGNDSSDWYIIAEINRDSTDVANLHGFLQNEKDLAGLVNADIGKGTGKLKRMVAFADGFQTTGTEICTTRHYNNTLYNIMRGGVFLNNYTVDIKDFKHYVWQINRMVSKEFQSWLNGLPESISYGELIDLAEGTGNSDLVRITIEYLPLTFSRRHGDPSRPWNLFSIETKNDDGSVKYNYEGNWRDIFQNWEALCFSFPEFVEGMISKFVNATTIDGYNPYRIMREGIDWECPDPDDPWAYIGYWGDHQIIYLQKLLELSDNYHPQKLDDLLLKEIFTYANVPYRIKPYEELVKDPKDTILFDHELNSKIEGEAKLLGNDAKLVREKGSEQILKVNLAEKILVTLLSKVSNMIPEAGIWMNTQRPEWNDANNALVGNGASMVTLYYLRRFLKFLQYKFGKVTTDDVLISEELAELLNTIKTFLEENTEVLDSGFSASDRKRFADSLGRAHSRYRTDLYDYSFSGERKPVRFRELASFMELLLKFTDHSIEANKRADGLYHAYNLILISDDEIRIRYLYEMLEGQVAVLSCGKLSPEESLEVLDSLKTSKMFRPDQFSYMLYPDRQLKRFTDKNIVPKEKVGKSQLLNRLVEDGETSIIKLDKAGNYHFNSEFRNADALAKALDDLRYGEYSNLIEKEKDLIINVYEEVFDHQSFTGRSGTFYGYEGLGSIYWHMVSKLLLAAQESFFKAVDEGADPEIIGKLKDHYYEIKAGIGLYKSPDVYGAFPMDAYSHTPANSGVKQPGLTGQVKEDVISRLGELGVQVNDGQLCFDFSLFNSEEILDNNSDLEFYNLEGEWQRITLKPGQWGLTFCQVPLIVSLSEHNTVSLTLGDGRKVETGGLSVDKDYSKEIFHRSGEVRLIEVSINKNLIR